MQKGEGASQYRHRPLVLFPLFLGVAQQVQNPVEFLA